MLPVTDPVTKFEQEVDRQSRLGIIAFSGISAVEIGTFGYLFFTFPDAFPPTFFWFLMALPFPFGVLLFSIRKRTRRVRGLARALSHRLSSAGGRGLSLVFDNGVVMSVMDRSPGLRFYAFGSPGGGRVTPNSAEVGRFLRGLIRMRTILQVSRNKGPESLRARLDAIRTGMLAKFALLFVYGPRRTAPVDLQWAAWIATATIGVDRFKAEPDRILQQIDHIGSLLEEAVAAALAAESQVASS